MTRYDPFSYGQVPLDPKSQGAAPDDMLFAEDAPVKRAAAAESDWAPPPADYGSAFQQDLGATQDALAFGADILGEAVPGPAAAAPPARPLTPAPRVNPTSGPRATTPATVQPGSLRPASATKGNEAMPTRAPAKLGIGAMPMPRRTSVASVVVPLAVVAGGGAAAAWLYLAQQNPIMAGILGVTSLVGAAMARVLLRG